jgi:hypothetical protein
MNNDIAPTIGRIVHVHRGLGFARPANSNSSSLEKPIAAVITAVWSNDCINVKAFHDGPEDQWLTSILFGDMESALAKFDMGNGAVGVPNPDSVSFWCWPPKA